MEADNQESVNDKTAARKARRKLRKQAAKAMKDRGQEPWSGTQLFPRMRRIARALGVRKDAK